MARRKPKPKKSKIPHHQREVILRNTYTRLIEVMDAHKRQMKAFGETPDLTYSSGITILLKTVILQFLEVRHAQGEDRHHKDPTEGVELMEDLVHDTGAFLCHMLEKRDKGSRYAVEFLRKGP